MPGSALRAPSSGRPFENFTAAVLLVHGFIVDIDLMWAAAGQGDIAQFDCIASAAAGQRIQRVIVECKGGNTWGYSDAFQLLGQMCITGGQNAILFVAHRLSAERTNRSPVVIDRRFAPLGLRVLAIQIDDRVPTEPVIDIDKVGGALFAYGFMPMPNSDLRAEAVEVCARSIARLRGAVDRVMVTLAEPMSPLQPPAASLLQAIRDWTVVSGSPADRFEILQGRLTASNTSQAGWNPETVAAHPHFSRDVAIVELYAAAQAVAAVGDAIRSGWVLPRDFGISNQLRQRVSTLDLHAIAHAAYILALVPPTSDLAVAARRTYGPTVAELTVSRRLRQRCRDPRPRRQGSRRAIPRRGGLRGSR